MHTRFGSPAATASDTSPEMPLTARNRILPRIMDNWSKPQPPDLSIGQMAGQPFRCDFCARHHP
jgi:hypothetical protein